MTIVKGIVAAAFSPTGVDRSYELSKMPKLSKDAVLSVASCMSVLLENDLSYEEAFKINSCLSGTTDSEARETETPRCQCLANRLVCKQI